MLSCSHWTSAARLCAVAGIFGVSALLLPGCTIGKPAENSKGEPSSEAPQPSVDALPSPEGDASAPDTPVSAPSGANADEQAKVLHEAVSHIAAQYGASADVAIVSLPDQGDPKTVFASSTAGTDPAQAEGRAAWSTSKVPLAMATIQQNQDETPITPALEVSDNGAAEQMWNNLGAGEQAAQSVDDVLRQGSDEQTMVQPNVTRPGFTAFGQTQWTAPNQARFAAHLACTEQSAIAGASQVVAHLHNVSDGYGLSTIAGGQVAFKGGWGPSANGGYDARQLGVYAANGHKVGISIATTASDFATAQQVLTSLAGAVEPMLESTPASSC